MLFDQDTLSRIVAGEVTLAFRKFRRRTVRTGGTLQTGAGVIAIDSIVEVAETDISEDDASRAGYPSRTSLLAALSAKQQGKLCRVAFHYAGADPRIALRAALPTEEELADITSRLERMDARSPIGPWTARVLRLIEAQPGVRAANLAKEFGQETFAFKANVRKLKALGLTESLEIGYRLSPRGRVVLSKRGAE